MKSSQLSVVQSESHDACEKTREMIQSLGTEVEGIKASARMKVEDAKKLVVRAHQTTANLRFLGK